MKFVAQTATALTLVLALAACGGGDDDEPTGDLAAEVEVPEVAVTTTPLGPDGEPIETGSAQTPAAAPTTSPTPTPTPTATTAAATPTPSPTRVAASGPPAAFATCSACHAVAAGRHGIGPSLAGVFGDRAATQAGFEYSEALRDSGLTWNAATLHRYLGDPLGVVPGTKMAYPGLKDATQRQAVIDYLRTL